MVTALVHLLVAATDESDRLDEFDEDFLRDQQVKLLQIRAARALLADQRLLRLW